jgi:arylsulfatase A
LVADRAETKNLAVEQPEIVARLNKRLDQIVAEGRSTPGVPQKNAVAINVRNPVTVPAK